MNISDTHVAGGEQGGPAGPGGQVSPQEGGQALLQAGRGGRGHRAGQGQLLGQLLGAGQGQLLGCGD